VLSGGKPVSTSVRKLTLFTVGVGTVKSHKKTVTDSQAGVANGRLFTECPGGEVAVSNAMSLCRCRQRVIWWVVKT
jgi:hypothetical protein